MITYVNTVLVGTGKGTINTSVTDPKNYNTIAKGEFIVVDAEGALITSAADAQKAEAIKVGLKNANGIKWSNIIKKADIKSYNFETYTQDTEDEVEMDFATAVAAAANESVRIVVRLTFKDLPTKYRKWTESYEIEVAAGSTAKQIVDAFVNTINVKNAKRARVIASNVSDKLVIEAMAYDDDNTVPSISPANKVRFSANAWLTKPEAKGFASKNKYGAATITKTPGTYYTGSAKLVRDAEYQAMGYQGILNRGEGTWPIIMPAMNTDLTKTYDSLTLEFENMYRAADDIQRKTKQTLQVFDIAGKLGTASTGLKVILDAFVTGEHAAAYKNFGTKDAEK